MNAVPVFSVTFWHERGKKWILRSQWSYDGAYDGVPAHLDLPYASPLAIAEKVLSCLKATPVADILSPELERCACITGIREEP